MTLHALDRGHGTVSSSSPYAQCLAQSLGTQHPVRFKMGSAAGFLPQGCGYKVTLLSHRWETPMTGHCSRDPPRLDLTQGSIHLASVC